MQANFHRCCPVGAVRSMPRVPSLSTAASVQGKVRFDLHIVDGLVSVTQRTWGLGLRVDERASGE